MQQLMRNIGWAVAVLAASLLQTAWPDALKLQEVLPDLTLILVVYFAIVEGEERAMFTAVLGGLYQDVASNAVLGHHVLCLVIVGYSVGRFSTRLVTEHPAVKAGLVMLAAIAQGTLFTIVAYVQNPEVRFFYTIATSVIPSAFYTALLTPIVFALLGQAFVRRHSLQGGLS